MCQCVCAGAVLEPIRVEEPLQGGFQAVWGELSPTIDPGGLTGVGGLGTLTVEPPGPVWGRTCERCTSPFSASLAYRSRRFAAAHGDGVGSRFRSMTHHLARPMAENDSRPLCMLSSIPARTAALVAASVPGIQQRRGLHAVSPELYLSSGKGHTDTHDGSTVVTVYHPDSGRIVIDGADIMLMSRSRLAACRAANIGYVFQTHNLIPVLTAYENIELPLLLLRMSRAERRRREEVALRAVGLLDRTAHYPRQLSGGQEQRVGIARAIIAHPKVVVADEPTGDLDEDTAARKF